MDNEIKVLNNIKVEFDENRILRLIGYKRENLKDSVKKIINEEKEKLGKLITPLSLYAIIDYDKTNKHPIFENAAKVAICICTIGGDLEKEASFLMKNNEMLRAIILDALGSEAAEEVAIQSDKIIADKALGMDLWPSKRFSPGYGKWDIREQGYVFELLPSEKIGVKLNPSFMMIPRKSISFRINFYKEKELTTRRIK